jgi:hypothetical protein
MVPAELLGVNLMFDNDIQLMVSIFHKAYQLKGAEEGDPVKYVKTYKADIEEAGQLLGCLGLAVPDIQSPLGWKPTPALRNVAFGKADSDRAFCAFMVLRALGLVREAYDGNPPTLRLEQLLAEAYHDRRAKKGKPKELVMGVANKIFYDLKTTRSDQ